MEYVTIEVIIAVDEDPVERAAAYESYEPTEDEPVPPEDWVTEEVALCRLDSVPGICEMVVTDVSTRFRTP